MKASTFFSALLVAGTAIAAPFQGETRAIDVSVKDVSPAVNAPINADVADKRQAPQISDLTGLVGALTGASNGASGPLSALTEIIGSIQNGDTTPDEGAAASQPQLEEIEQVLQNLVLQLTGAAGLNVRESDLNIVLTLVNTLLAQVLTTVNALVLVLGLRPQLNSLLASVLGLVAKVLVLLIGLLAGLLPGLVAGLSPLLAALGNGLLAPLLTPIVAALVPLQNPGLPPLA